MIILGYIKNIASHLLIWYPSWDMAPNFVAFLSLSTIYELQYEIKTVTSHEAKTKKHVCTVSYLHVTEL